MICSGFGVELLNLLFVWFLNIEFHISGDGVWRGLPGGVLPGVGGGVHGLPRGARGGGGEAAAHGEHPDQHRDPQRAPRPRAYHQPACIPRHTLQTDKVSFLSSLHCAHNFAAGLAMVSLQCSSSFSRWPTFSQSSSGLLVASLLRLAKCSITRRIFAIRVL